jgi:hypothetical protein
VNKRVKMGDCAAAQSPQLVKKVPSGFFAKLPSELQNEIL